MRKQTNSPQQGQAMIIMVLGLVALLGMVALAIDGGRVYTERRTAQNAADASAMAAVRELGSGASSVTARQVAINTAAQNQYDLTPDEITISTESISYGSYNTGKTAAYVVNVDICSQIEATFAQFIFGDLLDVCAHSQMEVRLKTTPFAGFGVVALGTSDGNCPGVGSDGYGLGVGGGGNSGGISLYGASMLSNISQSGCAYYPPGQNADGIYACTVEFDIGTGQNGAEACLAAGGQLINLQAVGNDSCTGSACGNMGNVDGGINDGLPVQDPLANLPTPVCTGPDIPGQNPPLLPNGHYQPGTYYRPGNMAAGIYDPGIYCIKAYGTETSNGNAFAVNGGLIDASSGVMFYLFGDDDYAAHMNIGGNSFGGFDLRAPGNGTSLTCPNEPEPVENTIAWRSNPCNYKGMAIFVQQGKSSTIGLGGNGSYEVWGTIYGSEALLNAHGGGNSVYETQVHGQIIVKQVLNDGGGSLQVWYDENVAYIIPPYINALQ